MLKKLVIFGIVGFVAVSAVKGSKIGSYIRSEIDAMKARCEANIPPEKEIGRLRNEIKQLDKDILGVVNQLAKERVEVAQGRETANELRAQQSKDKELLTARATSIKNATEQVTFGDRTLSIAAAKSELEDGVKRYSANQKSLESMDTALVSREKVKETLEKQLETMKSQKARTDRRGGFARSRADRAQAPADGKQVPDGRHPTGQDQGRHPGAADEDRDRKGEAETPPGRSRQPDQGGQQQQVRGRHHGPARGPGQIDQRQGRPEDADRRMTFGFTRN